ncbi:MAG TPA: ribose 5-phosphate isomerase B [Kofleriaceae bacterium]|nr:ribose 5-phosphate isomerase B [Kofleriaceae bacterium]
MKWFAGSDHAGFELKQSLIAELRSWGDDVIDLGTDGTASVDYPEFGAAVGREAVEAGAGVRGLVVCGSGIGISIAANKVPGVRCALVHDTFTAIASRQHNDANVVAMGQRVIGLGVAIAALRAFRDTEFEGGRHQRRVDQLNALAKEF